MTSDLVAVTGANGFLGSHIVDQLVKAHVKTRAIVRSERSADQLRKLYPDQIKSGLLEFAFVADIAKEDGHVYDEAFKGATGLIHTASPIFDLGGKSEDKEGLFLKPAIHGALNAVKAAHRTPTIRKVVFTSSVVAAAPPKNAGKLDHDYFPEVTYEQAAKLEEDREAYAASKVLAEKAVWDFIKQNKPKFTLTALLVGLIVGPNLNGKTSETGSNSIILALVKYPTLMTNMPVITVQDTAAAHINALNDESKSSETDGRRLFVIEKILFSKDAVRLATEHVPTFPSGEEPSSYPEEGTHLVYDSEQQKDSTELLGLDFNNNAEAALIQLLRDSQSTEKK